MSSGIYLDKIFRKLRHVKLVVLFGVQVEGQLLVVEVLEVDRQAGIVLGELHISQSRTRLVCGVGLFIEIVEDVLAPAPVRHAEQ